MAGGGGGGGFNKNRGRGGVPRRRRGRGERAPGECLWGVGGELNIFFGAEMPTKNCFRDIFCTLRAKGALISEPRLSTPCEMRFFPREKGKTAFSKRNPRQRPFSLSRVGKIASRRG